MRPTDLRRAFFLCFPLWALTALPITAHAEGLRTKDVLGIAIGMTVEQAQAKIHEYNPAMIIQRINTVATAETPSYTSVLQGDILPETAGNPPQDEITVHFVQYTDGSVRADAIAHFVFPLPEDQRITFQRFVDKLTTKYGPASTINAVGASEARWVFNDKGVLKLASWGGDITDYNRCNGIIPYITNSETRAGLPTYAMRDCGDFLYVRLFSLDSEHANTLTGYYMLYVNQEKYLADITGIDPSARSTQNTANTPKGDAKNTQTNSAGPKF